MDHNACGTPDCCGGCPTARPRQMDLAWMAFLATKPRPSWRGEMCCEDACKAPVFLLGRCSAHWRLLRLIGMPAGWL